MTLENIEKRSRQLMNEHGLHNWELGFDRATKRLGACHWYRKKITLSTQFALRNPWEQVKLTVLHEIAHALCGEADGHNRVWRDMYTSIGGVAQRDYTVVKMPPLKQGKCPNCKRIVKARRRTNIACGKCCDLYNKGKYSYDYKIIWK